LAYFAPCSISDAAAVLEDLAARSQLTMDIQDDGSVVYELPGRQRISVPGRDPAESRLAPAIIRTRRGGRHASPFVAAALTTFVPGAGHLYAGRVLAAIMWFLVVGAGYALILPGLILHMFAVVSSAAAALRGSSRAPRLLVAST
jgi:hypothetical protein